MALLSSILMVAQFYEVSWAASVFFARLHDFSFMGACWGHLWCACSVLLKSM